MLQGAVALGDVEEDSRQGVEAVRLLRFAERLLELAQIEVADGSVDELLGLLRLRRRHGELEQQDRVEQSTLPVRNQTVAWGRRGARTAVDSDGANADSPRTMALGKKLGIVGCGNIGEALLKGLLASGLATADEIYASAGPPAAAA